MKKLTFETGNLLTHPRVQVIGHQANTQHVMGSGIAKSIKEMYPEAYQVDAEAHNWLKNSMGMYSCAEIPLINGVTNRHGNKICRIYNLYGQNLGTGWGAGGRKTNYEALYSALEGMANSLRSTEADKLMFDYCREPVVGFPYLMGAVRGGGAWPIVERLIEVAFDGYDGEVVIVKL